MSDNVKIISSRKDIVNFSRKNDIRKETINEASDSAARINYAVNSVAGELHPDIQYLVIKNIEENSRDHRTYTLVPDTSRGTAMLAYFRPGQYISVTLHIGQSVLTRAYPLCSSPADALNDEYKITVRKRTHGFASTYIFNNWQKGTQIEASSPFGNFYHQVLRDSNNVIGITDTEGAANFLSMARATADNSININLTLLYGCRKKKEAIFTDEFNELDRSCDKFKIIYVFSDEKSENCERGFITRTIIEKYAPSQIYSVFVNGSIALYKLAATQLSELKFERKYFRFGMSGQIVDPASLKGFPADKVGKIFKCKVYREGQPIIELSCSSEETLLVSLERAGINSVSLCRSGECGFCRSKLLSGNVFIPKGIDYRRAEESSYGIIHPCCSYPMSDLTLSL